MVDAAQPLEGQGQGGGAGGMLLQADRPLEVLARRRLAPLQEVDGPDVAERLPSVHPIPQSLPQCQGPAEHLLRALQLVLAQVQGTDRGERCRHLAGGAGPFVEAQGALDGKLGVGYPRFGGVDAGQGAEGVCRLHGDGKALAQLQCALQMAGGGIELALGA